MMFLMTAKSIFTFTSVSKIKHSNTFHFIEIFSFQSESTILTRSLLTALDDASSTDKGYTAINELVLVFISYKYFTITAFSVANQN